MKQSLQFYKNNLHWLGAGLLLTFSSSFGQTFFISIFAGNIMAEFQLSDGQWGAVYSLGTTASAFLMLWSGELTDRYRARSLGRIFLVLLAVACVLMAINPWVWLLPVAVFCLRFCGQGMLSHIPSVAMARWFSAARGKALSFSALGFSFGEALLPVSFVSLMVFLPWRSLWLVAAVSCLLMIPILRHLLVRERAPQTEDQEFDHPGMKGLHWTRSMALGHPLFWLVLPLTTAPGIFGTALFFQQVHLSTTKGWSHTQFVALFPAYTLATIGAMLVYGWAVDRWNTARLMPFFALPMALGFLVLGQGTTLYAALIGFLLIGLMQGGWATMSGAFWAEFYGTRHLGAIKALATSLMVFGSALGPGVTGLLIDQGIWFQDQMIFIAIYVVIASALTAYGIRRVTAGAKIA